MSPKKGEKEGGLIRYNVISQNAPLMYFHVMSRQYLSS